ncbi:MAG: GvpL/GvpF family gas vesicle protein [Pseudomonadota bacterium]
MTDLMLIGLVQGAPDCPSKAPPHRLIRVGPAHAIALDVPKGADISDEARALEWAGRSNAVLSAYAASGDVVPVSLGAVFSSVSALVAHVRRELPRVLRTAERLRGMVEYTLAVSDEQSMPKPISQVHQGRQFLRARQSDRAAKKAYRAKRQLICNRLLEVLKSQNHLCRMVTHKAPKRLMTAAILVPRAEVATLMAQLRYEMSREAALGFYCRLIGPSPAYSFTEEESVDA